MSRCTVLGPGEGKKYWLIGDHPTFKVGPEQTGKRYTVAENWVAPGGGPPPHVHAAEDEMFYVLEGQLQFMDNDKVFTGGPGTAVFLKRGVPHTFKNVGTTPARFVLTVTPSGFEAFVADCGEVIDSIPCDRVVDEAAIGKLLSKCQQYGINLCSPDHKVTGEAPARPKDREIWAMGQHVCLKMTAADTGGAFSVCEATSAPGTGVPPHLHHHEDEIFYVLEGTYEFQVGNETYLAKPGAFLHVPKGVMHGFRNVGDTHAKLYDCHTPGGFEAFFEEVGTPCVDKRLGPPQGPPPDMAKLMAIIEKHGMVMPPPPAGN